VLPRLILLMTIGRSLSAIDKPVVLVLQETIQLSIAHERLTDLLAPLTSPGDEQQDLEHIIPGDA
jgi:hypothetical protein